MQGSTGAADRGPRSDQAVWSLPILGDLDPTTPAPGSPASRHPYRKSEEHFKYPAPSFKLSCISTTCCSAGVRRQVISSDI